MIRYPGVITALISSLLLLQACATQMPADQDESSSKTEMAQQQLAEQMQQMEPEFLYLAAQNAIKDGNTELAAEFLTALVVRDPDSIEPHVQLAGLLLQLDRSDEAEMQIETLLKKPLQEGDHEKLLITQARLKVGSNKQEEALQLLDALFEKNPVHIQGRDLQARILADQNRLDDALAAIDKAILIEELPQFRLLQAQLLLKQQEYRAAEISLNRLRKLAPENDAAVLMLSNIALKENKLAKAEKILRDFLQANPDAILVGHALGKVMIQDKRIPEAIMVYRDLASRTGDNPEILRTLGMLYFRYHDFEKAEQTFRKLYQGNPDDESRFYLASSLEVLQRPAEARELYEAVDPEGKAGPDAQVRLAGLDFADKQFKKAMARLERVLKSDPQHVDAQLLRSAIRLAHKQYRLLLEETEVALSMETVHPQILFNRAVAYENLNKHEELEKTLIQLLAADPKHSEAMNFLGYSYAVRGVQLNKAEMLIQQALGIKPDDGYYLDSLAWVYYKRGEYGKALETQQRAIKQVEDDPVMHEHLGDILWRAGEQEAARTAWQKAIDANTESPEKLRKKIAGGLQEGE
ncbi:Tetratricopeptide repeat-containing protein [Mariprofundus ferrinatatus]|uniref:Tetratricopeptide repeat-containing protein n=1 Tax=Mariprofundus ferrinatatus TaxID=1921087 RepID=A0A2K8L2P4_9PROT|nr:tetratricopeptide repeat protein [Mariprofundus ferrinatatus]ATX81372.1 Tetratricopeptide repeat-containing protein [Mariprofundus ferrinatatus]